MGIATHQAIDRLKKGVQPELAGDFEEPDNGNGSLMRILPLVFYIKDKEIHERYQITKQVSSLTHGHIRSVIACFHYLEFARQLLEGKDKFDIYKNLQSCIPAYLHSISINPIEIEKFDRLLKDNIASAREEDIHSSGYVVHTLEASVWCLLTTNNYSEAVLKAVNLGEDTDTTGAVTGGLTGILYGFENMPAKWVSQLSKLEDVHDLVNRLTSKYGI